MRHVKNIFAGFWLSVILTACMGLAQNLESFEDRAAYTAILISNVADTAAARYEQGALSKNSANDVLIALKTSQDLLELANTAYKAGNVTDANNTLASAISILNELERRVGK